MANIGGQLGNKNAVASKPWTDALQRAIAQDNGKRLRAGAEALLDKIAEGDTQAIALLADRMEGKAPQSLTLQGDEQNPLLLVISHGMELDSTDLLDKIRGDVPALPK